MSPGSRALQTHAPGQSLPQGLAAGYSRIHALPPLPLNSPGSSRGIPGTSGSYIPGSNPLSSSFTGSSSFNSIPPAGEYDGISGTTPTKAGHNSLEQMLGGSKVSYSQAARIPPVTGSNNATGVSPFMPPQVSRVASGRGPGNVSSPLASQGVPTRDDSEDLFDFE